MKMQRLVLLLLAVNLVLLVGYVTEGRSSAQTAEPIVRTRALELVDARGRIRSRLNVEADGAVVLRLIDQSGTIRVKLGADEDGSGLVLNDETTDPGVHIVARRAPTSERPKTTSITLTGAGGRQRVITP